MRLPDCLILGEMKCGTTTLWDLMTQDPRVFAHEQKELHFFGSYSYFGASGGGELGDPARYAAHFADAREDQLCGDATPNYLVDPLAADRIRGLLPGARLVVTLRDPIERAWSHYWHMVRREWEPLGFAAALDAEEARIAESYDQHEKFSYVRRGRYVEGLKRYEALFGREAIHVVFLGDLKGRPRETLESVWRHIGLGPPFPELDRPSHRNRATYPKSAALGRVTHAAMQRARRRGGVVLSVAQRLRDKVRPMLTYSGQPEIEPRVRRRLADAFADADRELAEWLGRPLPWRPATDAAA